MPKLHLLSLLKWVLRTLCNEETMGHRKHWVKLQGPIETEETQETMHGAQERLHACMERNPRARRLLENTGTYYRLQGPI
jgi:hypothetical protein